MNNKNRIDTKIFAGIDSSHTFLLLGMEYFICVYSLAQRRREKVGRQEAQQQRDLTNGTIARKKSNNKNLP